MLVLGDQIGANRGRIHIVLNLILSIFTISLYLLGLGESKISVLLVLKTVDDFSEGFINSALNCVLPYSNHLPTRFAEFSIHNLIPFHIAGDFLPPEQRIGVWDFGMKSATVPETAINENSQLLSFENDIRPANQLLI